MSTTITKKQALEAAQCISSDIEMLADGSWEPDADSCEATQDNIQVILSYLEEEGS